MDNKLHNKNHNTLSDPINTAKRFIWLTFFLSLATLTMLSGCGGGADSQSRPAPADDDEVPVYTGSLQSDDIKAFKKELWEKVSPSSVCGRCHRSDADSTNRQTPYFADWLDVNIAYDEVVSKTPPLVDLLNPADSILVKRVAGGHQCWLSTSSQCANEMTKYIEAWANGSKKGTTEVEFSIEPPTRLEPPGDSLFFPVTAPEEFATETPKYDSPLYALVKAQCSGCHDSTASSAQSPFFADGNIETSYQAIKLVVNLNTPEESRVIKRLQDNHNCWSTCSADATEMQNKITDFAGTLTAANYDMDDAVSYALQMQEGSVAASHNRYESDQIAFYEFKSGSINPDSNIIYDTSGVEPAINLTVLDSNYRWLGNWGIEFTDSRGAMASVDDSRKLFNLIRLTGEYTVEAWVIPANVNQEDTTIVAYSGDSTERNFALGQTMYNYDFFQRSSTLDAAGEPKLMTNDDDEDLQATLQHVVITYSRENGRRIYVNGQFTDDIDPEEAGDLLNWHSSYALSFGNEASNDRGWDGILRMVAIHDRALNNDQIQQNYLAEVGQKFQVPFSVSHIIGDGVPHSYVVFEVSQFDEYSYLFRNPRFINIDPDTLDYTPPDMAIRGMRIGMNNQIVTVGQAYNNISMDNVADGYSADTGKILSTVDTVIQIQNGASGTSADEFFLTFDEFGGKTYTFTEVDQTIPPPLPTVADVNLPSYIGIRTFDEINASMANMTGITTNWQTVTKITDVFSSYRTQLPATEDIETFQGSHQMAVAQLAMAYCDEVVENNPSYFPDFIFDPVSTAFVPPVKVENVIAPLLQKMFNATDLLTDHATNNLTTQPSVLDVRDELTWLIIGNGGSRSGMVASSTCATTEECTTRTKNIVKAACASALGSAAMLIQ